MLGRLAVTTAVVLLGAVVAGCREERTAVTATTKTTSPAPPVGEPEWRAVIDDWYDNGTFEDAHRCAAVRAAIERLPGSTPSYSTHRADFRAYEQRVCPSG